MPGILRQSPCFFTSCRFSLEKSSAPGVDSHSQSKRGWIKIHLKLDMPYSTAVRKKHTRKFNSSTLHTSFCSSPLRLFPHFHCVFKRELRAQKNLLFIAGAEPTFTTTIWIAGIRIITFARTPLVMFWLCPARKSNI